MVLETHVAFRYTLVAFLTCFRVFFGGVTVFLSHALEATILGVVSVYAMTRFFDRRFFSDLVDVGESFENLLATRFAVVDNFFHNVIGL